MTKKICKIAIDVLIIAASFAVAEFFTEQVIHSDKWYWDLLVYMATYLLLSYAFDFAKKCFKKKENNQEDT